MPPRRSRARSSARILDALPEAVVLTLLAALPAFINLATARIFEEEKGFLLRAGAAIALAAGAWHWRRYRDVARHPVVALYGLLLLSLAVSTALAVAPADALLGAYVRAHGLIAWLALGVVLAIACDVARTEDGRWRLAAALVVGSLWPALYAMVQLAGLDPLPWDQVTPGRAGSTLGNPLFLAGDLVVVVPVTAVAVGRSRVYLAALGLQLAALAAAGSRGPAAALVLALALGGAVRAMPRASWRTWAPLSALGVAMLLALLAPATRPSVVDRWLESGSGRVRILIWDGIGGLARDSGPRLWTGYGPESLRRVFPPYYTAEIGRIEGTEAMPDRAHNDLLDALVSAGIPGLLIELGFFIAVVVAAVRVREPSWRAGTLAAAVAHLAEIQLGIATVASRLAFVTVIALAVGLQLDTPMPARTTRDLTGRRVPWRLLAGVAALAAAAPLLARAIMRLPAYAVAPDATGPAYAFWLPAIVLYLPLGGLACLLATRLPPRPPLDASPGPRRAALAAALAGVAMLSLVPSTADAFARAGTNLFRAGRFPAAVAAWERAARLQPRQDAYATSLAGAVIQASVGLDPSVERAGMQRALALLERVRARHPRDPSGPRNLASLYRTYARTADEAERQADLTDADDLYAEAVTLAPGMPALWTEWANVKLERGRPGEAAGLLDRALAIDDTRADPWLLLGITRFMLGQTEDAIEAYDEALARDPGNALAAEGRDEALGALAPGAR